MDIRFDIENKVVVKLKAVLVDYGSNEIGGMILGVKLKENHFLINDITIADDIGVFNVAKFIREPYKSMKVIIKSFKSKSGFYLGEWHSHPSFQLKPSSGDINTMFGILKNEHYGVNFVLLIITGLRNGNVDYSGFLFHKELSSFIESKIKIT